MGTDHAALGRYVSRCAGRGDLPRVLRQGAVGSAALHEGAATALHATSGIKRDSLDAAWARAPAAARDCAKANAAKMFSVAGPACPDPAVPIWFLRQIGISLAANRVGATWALYSMNAKVQEDWAESLIGQFTARAAP